MEGGGEEGRRRKRRRRKRGEGAKVADSSVDKEGGVSLFKEFLHYDISREIVCGGTD